MTVGVAQTAGSSKTMVYHRAEDPVSTADERRWGRWAALPYPILIRGERGTGKTVLASWLHARSGRTGPFVNASLAQISKGLEIAELLGHTRGAFTSAVADRKGVFEQAHGGTVFLDELGRASPEAQNALLGLLDHRRVTRVGGSRPLPLNVRVMAATNARLEELVREGTFSADLLDRFGYYTIQLTPLRQRRRDILPLLVELLHRECSALGRNVPVVSPAVARLLLRAPWPGNVRDLVKLAEYLAGNEISTVRIPDLPPAFLETLGMNADAPEESDQDRIRRVLGECGGNVTQAARRLQMSRSQLYRLHDVSRKRRRARRAPPED